MRDLKYDFAAIEPKWQKKWQETGVYQTGNHSDKPKFYALVEFPYPSGQGLHVGHARPYTAMDVVARKRRMDGYNEMCIRDSCWTAPRPKRHRTRRHPHGIV